MMGGKFLASCGVLLALSGTATAKPFEQLWVFGDSSVDTGWYRKAPYSGEPNYDFYIKQPAAQGGRPTSGPGEMSVQVLAHAISLATGPANQGSTDYATGGARDYLTNTATSGGFLHAVPTRTQLVDYMHAHDHL